MSMRNWGRDHASLRRLAILALDLRRLAEEREDGEADIRNELGQVSIRVAELGAELHRVSHELHPALLE